MAVEAAASQEDRRACILLVEDEGLLREVMQEELVDAGYEVIAAETGEEALTIIRDRWREIDILFTDIRLPGSLDGWNLAFEYRFLRPEAPVIYATGFAKEEKQVFGSILLHKPFRMDQALEALKSLTGAA